MVLGFLCLGTSGEPIKDVMRYSKIENSLDVMKKTLQWRNIAPTCPDTIPCTPCIDTDPFIMYNCPAIYFSGNCTEFATEIFEGTVVLREIIYYSYGYDVILIFILFIFQVMVGNVRG